MTLDQKLPAMFAKDIGNADRVLVIKSERTLTLLRDGERIKTYRISLGDNPQGAKERQGDSKTPEGEYILDWRNPNSRFYLALHISYPNIDERAVAESAGLDPGGDIMIHGQRNGWGWLSPLMSRRDWTDGCIAVTNTAMHEIWNAVTDGTPIEIRP